MVELAYWYDEYCEAGHDNLGASRIAVTDDGFGSLNLILSYYANVNCPFSATVYDFY